MTTPVKRYYGWLPSKPDFRDRMYTAPHSVVAALPAKVDLTEPALGEPFEPTINQGQLGSCGPNSISMDLVYTMLKLSQPVDDQPSRLFIYYFSRLLMGQQYVNQDTGVDNRTMLKALNQFGWCDEALWPYDISKFTQKPSQQAIAQAAERVITGYAAVPQDINQMRGCLAAGRPFLFGFTVYSSFESQTVAQTGEVPMPSRGDRVLGGHDVLIVGYDDGTQRYKFKNPWGPEWGQQGYGTMPYGMAHSASYSQDFWTVTDPHIAPAPGPGPTPSKITLSVTLPTDMKAGTYQI